MCKFNIQKIEWEKKDMEVIFSNVKWELERVVQSQIQKIEIEQKTAGNIKFVATKS